MLPSQADQPRVQARTQARFDKKLYRRSNIIKRTIGHMKDKPAVGTRFDKLALTYQAMVQAALINSYVRRLHPSDNA
jgi:hypothetical protein